MISYVVIWFGEGLTDCCVVFEAALIGTYYCDKRSSAVVLYCTEYL